MMKPRLSGHKNHSEHSTRRRFLLKTSLATAGVALSANYLSSRTLKSEPVGIGVIGSGQRGQGLASLIRDIDGLEVKAVCDVIPFRLEKAGKYLAPGGKRYTDYHKLLANREVDAVLITVPFGLHEEVAIAALQADKHVYCEKTMAYGVDAIKRLMTAAHASKKVFQTGHQYRNSRLYCHVVSLIHQGYLGEISHIHSQWNRNGDWRRRVPDPKWEKMINWRMYREYSGGLTAELCSHQIDFANWILNDRPHKVTGFGGIDYWKDGRETRDNVHLVTEYPNGAKATYTSLTTNSKGRYEIKILGKKGSIVIDRDNAYAFKEPEKKNTELGIVDGVSGATLRAWQVGEGAKINVIHKDPSIQALADFRDNILNDKIPLSNVKTGADVSVVVQMALDAMDQDRVVYGKDYNF